MRHRMSAAVASLLMASLAVPSLTFAAEAKDSVSASVVVLDRAAIERAVASIPVEVVRPTAVAAAQMPLVPRTLPKPKSRARFSTGMVIGTVVSSVVGLATTVYMLKYMKDQQEKEGN
jgi:hypothetical protein